jgi:glucokinase
MQQQARSHPDEFSASRLATLAFEPGTVSNTAIAEAYRASDPFTVNIINQSVTPLAAMLVNIFLALGLDRFILIGGFTFALGENYRLEIARQAAELCWDNQADWCEMIRFGDQDDVSGLIGAGRLACGRTSF